MGTRTGDRTSTQVHLRRTRCLSSLPSGAAPPKLERDTLQHTSKQSMSRVELKPSDSRRLTRTCRPTFFENVQLLEHEERLPPLRSAHNQEHVQTNSWVANAPLP